MCPLNHEARNGAEEPGTPWRDVQCCTAALAMQPERHSQDRWAIAWAEKDGLHWAVWAGIRHQSEWQQRSGLRWCNDPGSMWSPSLWPPGSKGQPTSLDPVFPRSSLESSALRQWSLRLCGYCLKITFGNCFPQVFMFDLTSSGKAENIYWPQSEVALAASEL